jgi:Tol biopolymer transport system component
MRWAWRLLGPILLLGSLAPLGAPAPGPGSTVAAAQPLAPDAGLVAVARGRGIGVVDAAGGGERLLPLDLGDGLARQPTWAPDRGRLALGWLSRRAGERTGGGEILLLPSTGGSPTVIVPRDADGVMLDNPAWAPDGRTLFFESQLSASQYPRIEQVGADGRDRRLLLARAGAPSPMPGGQLLYVRQDQQPAIALLNLADGSQRVLVDDARFFGFASPRASPDGEWIAFAATGGPVGRAAQPRARFDALPLGKPVAHGLPWRVWLVRADGTGLRALDWEDDDELTVAWAPGGRLLAAYGVAGLVLLSPETAEVRPLAQGGFGGMDWAR